MQALHGARVGSKRSMHSFSRSTHRSQAGAPTAAALRRPFTLHLHCSVPSHGRRPLGSARHRSAAAKALLPAPCAGAAGACWRGLSPPRRRWLVLRGCAGGGVPRVKAPRLASGMGAGGTLRGACDLPQRGARQGGADRRQPPRLQLPTALLQRADELQVLAVLGVARRWRAGASRGAAASAAGPQGGAARAAAGAAAGAAARRTTGAELRRQDMVDRGPCLPLLLQRYCRKLG